MSSAVLAHRVSLLISLVLIRRRPWCADMQRVMVAKKFTNGRKSKGHHPTRVMAFAFSAAFSPDRVRRPRRTDEFRATGQHQASSGERRADASPDRPATGAARASKSIAEAGRAGTLAMPAKSSGYRPRRVTKSGSQIPSHAGRCASIRLL